MDPAPADRSALIERIKELNCLFEISRLFARNSCGLEELLQAVVAIVPRAWRYPEDTHVRISCRGREYRSGNYAPSAAAVSQPIASGNRGVGFIEVACHGGPAQAVEKGFLEEEKRLLSAIAELLGSMVEKKEAELALERTTRQLRRHKRALENKNIALREIVSQIGLEKQALQDQLRQNIELTVFPMLDKLQDPRTPPEAWRSYLKVVQQNLQDITSSFTRRVVSERVRLSPRELEICNLIKNGLANKEIAELLQVSLLTVERHRHNIRKKLRIDNQKINLATYLREL